jgi:hypothetical protein
MYGISNFSAKESTMRSVAMQTLTSAAMFVRFLAGQRMRPHS